MIAIVLMGQAGMGTFLMIAVVVLNLSILFFGIRSGLELYLAYRRRKSREDHRKALIAPQLATLYNFPVTKPAPVQKKPAA